MNKFILGLLLIAAVAGTFFVLQKQKTNTTVGINKELIFGKWKMFIKNAWLIDSGKEDY